MNFFSSREKDVLVKQTFSPSVLGLLLLCFAVSPFFPRLVFFIWLDDFGGKKKVEAEDFFRPWPSRCRNVSSETGRNAEPLSPQSLVVVTQAA